MGAPKFRSSLSIVQRPVLFEVWEWRRVEKINKFTWCYVYRPFSEDIMRRLYLIDAAGGDLPGVGWAGMEGYFLVRRYDGTNKEMLNRLRDCTF